MFTETLLISLVLVIYCWCALPLRFFFILYCSGCYHTNNSTATQINETFKRFVAYARRLHCFYWRSGIKCQFMLRNKITSGSQNRTALKASRLAYFHSCLYSVDYLFTRNFSTSPIHMVELIKVTIGALWRTN